MKKNIYPVLVLCFLWMGMERLEAQTVYGTYEFNGTTFLTAIDVSTCTACNVFEIPSTVAHTDVTILPDGRIILIAAPSLGFISIYTPPSSTPDIFPLDPPGTATGSAYFNNLLYIAGVNNGLYSFDPATDQFTYLGDWPAGFPLGAYLYVQGGNLFVITQDPPNQIWEVDLNDPGNSTLLQTASFPITISGATTVNNQAYVADFQWIYSYDPATNTYQQECNSFDMGMNGFKAVTELPPGTPAFPCLCVTDAGTVATGLDEICLPDDATVPFNNDEELDGDDLLQYILFSDLTDTLGSILVTSNTPDIAFDPTTMQTGITYYLATIAGNDLNGSVDLTDDCLSISNASEVIWWPQPEVSFAIASPDLCDGDCTTLEVTLTGTPPFDLAGEILAGTNVVGTFNENYLQNNGTLNACAPLGTAPGSLSVQAVTLSDARCSCL